MDNETLFSMIPDGAINAMYVSNENTQFRKMVADANKSGDCIINIHGGYYRPIPGVDDEAVKHYFARELHRAREILYKRKIMKESYEQWNR